MPVSTATRWRDFVPNSSSASSEIIVWAEKRDYLALQPALPYLPTISGTAPLALGRAASDSRGQPPYEESKTEMGLELVPEKRLQEMIFVSVLRCVKWYSLHVSEQASHPPSLLLL